MKNHERITALREAGYRVHVAHRRPTAAWVMGHWGKLQTRSERNLAPPVPKGGRTDVSIINDELGYEWHGEAVCSPRDNFSKRLGLTIALNRAIKEMDKEPF